MAYPTGIKLYIDDIDATYYVFGVRELDPTDLLNTWSDVDISQYLRKLPGKHTIRIVPTAGAGRVDVRLEIR